MTPSGVAVVMASSREYQARGMDQPIVMATGKEAIMNARPIMRRVEEVVAQPAEDHLAEQDGEHAADERRPPGHQRRQREREQQPGAHGAAVLHREALLHEPVGERLGAHRAGDRAQR